MGPLPPRMPHPATSPPSAQMAPRSKDKAGRRIANGRCAVDSGKVDLGNQADFEVGKALACVGKRVQRGAGEAAP
jgi:hypothetical protein